MSDSEINVDRLMYEIRETVARQKQGMAQNGSEPLNGFSGTQQSWLDQSGVPSALTLQPESHFRPKDQYHINELLKFHGAEFVRNSYRALLKREPDPAGSAQYLSSLESGRLNKIDILASLRHSPEGERARVNVAGLAWPAAIRRLERVPLIGYILESLIAVTRLPRLLQNFRRSEFYFLARQQEMFDHANQVDRGLSQNLSQLSAQTRAAIDRAETQQKAVESLALQQQRIVDRQKEANETIENRLSALREYLEQSTANLSRELKERAQEQQSRQEQLAQTMVDQERQLSEGQQQHAQQMAQEMEGQNAQRLELARQLEEQARGLHLRQQETRTELVMQERRLDALLAEGLRHEPGTARNEDLFASEAEHLLDPLYASFEDKFRGDREEVKSRLRVYLPILREAALAADVLDIGCGRGEWLELLKKEGVQARGVDRNRVFVEQCRQIGLDVQEQDALDYLRSVADKSLSVITSFHLVEHLGFEELIGLLDEMIRVLKPGGLLILETPNPENFMVGSYSFYADPTHRNPIPSPTLQFLLESRGLDRVSVMKLRPWDAAKIEGDTEIVKRFNEYFYGAPDYGILGWKV
jgi:O-antigen chain-terminating methyltransferase